MNNIASTASNCSPNASMFAPAVVTTRGTAELADTPKITQIDADKRDRGVHMPPGFTKWILTMGGDPTKAMVLSQVIFWFKKNDKGVPKVTHHAKGDPAFWLIKEYEELGAECGVTEKMAMDAVKWAADEDILIKETHGWGGKRATYIRLTCAEGGDYVTDHLQVMNFPYLRITTRKSLRKTATPDVSITTQESLYKLPAGSYTNYPQVLSNTESTGTESTIKEHLTSVTQKPVTAPVQPESIQAKSGKATPTPTPVDLHKGKPKLGSHLKSVKNDPPPNGNQPLALVGIYEAAMKEKYPKEIFLRGCTQDEVGMLHDLGNKVRAGDFDPAKVVPAAIQNWTKVLWGIRHEVELNPRPNVKQLLAHHGQIISALHTLGFIKSRSEAVKAVAEKPWFPTGLFNSKAVKAPPVPAPVPVDKPTGKQILNDIDEITALVKAKAEAPPA